MEHINSDQKIIHRLFDLGIFVKQINVQTNIVISEDNERDNHICVKCQEELPGAGKIKENLRNEIVILE